MGAFLTQNAEIIHADCLDAMRDMADQSIDAIVTDPPYFRVKSLPWDRQWDSAEKFIAWVGELCDEWRRILKPNGSLYVFASPRMAARVEVTVGQRFNIVNSITWAKPAFSTKAEMFRKSDLRSFFPSSERIIFAEHYGADSTALGVAGYGAKCDELRGFVFEPLRAYLDGERQRAGVTRQQIEEATGTQMFGHWFSRVQWALPTRAHYETLRELFNANATGEHLRREYEDLRREYEDLRREYEDLRRPFSVTADVPYTDVWTFATVPARKGKHPCEKPLDLLRHIIGASTKEGATVLDCFAGSGSTGEAALQLGRNFIGIEKDGEWVQRASARLFKVTRIAPTAPQPTTNATADLPLFAAAS